MERRVCSLKCRCREAPRSGNVVDAAELARITAALVGAIAEAKVRAKEYGIDPEFREIVRHAREMHFLLLEALLANKQSYRPSITAA